MISSLFRYGHNGNENLPEDIFPSPIEDGLMLAQD